MTRRQSQLAISNLPLELGLYVDKSLCGHVDKFANNKNKLWIAYVYTVHNPVDKLKKRSP